MADFLTAGRVRAAVTESFARLDELCTLPAGLLSSRPERPDAWTAAEHLEHVALANHFLLLTIKKGCRIALKRAAGGRMPEGESDLELLAPIGVPGAFDWLPPEHMVPTGARSLSDVRAELAGQREDCLELLAAMPRGEGRLYAIGMSVNRSGRLDMYQWMYFLVQHVRYHMVFIRELADIAGAGE